MQDRKGFSAIVITLVALVLVAIGIVIFIYLNQPHGYIPQVSIQPTVIQNGKLYANQNMGIQITVPQSWTVATSTNEDIISFQDNASATEYWDQGDAAPVGVSLNDYLNSSPVLTIHYFPDFQSWQKANAFSNCDTLAQCYASLNDPEMSSQVFANVDGEVIYVANYCGDVCGDDYVVQHNGHVYDFNTQSDFYYNDGSVERTLKFTN